MNHRKLLFGIIVLVVIPFLAFTISIAPPARVRAQSDPIPVIVNTDMAMDDWMAILYLLQRNDIEILAVTVTGNGEAHCDPGVRNAMNLLALAGNPDIPVACGRETSLEGNNTFPQEWRDWVDSMAMLTLPENPNTPVTQNAVELLQQTIQESEKPVIILAIGPLTTIAELLTADPTVIDQIEMIYIMGGAVEVEGNLQGGMETDNASAEWNTYVDAVAAAQVYESGAPITLISLDATNQTPLTYAFYDKLADDKTTPEAEFVYEVMSTFINYPGWYFWDQLAAVVVTDEDVVTIEDKKIRVITEEGPEHGRTLLDDEGNIVGVAVKVDAARFEEIYLNGLNGRNP